jgi:hypothetical protein
VPLTDDTEPDTTPGLPLKPSLSIGKLIFGGFLALVGVIMISNAIGLVTLREIERKAVASADRASLAALATDVERATAELRLAVLTYASGRRNEQRDEIGARIATLSHTLTEAVERFGKVEGNRGLRILQGELGGFTELFDGLVTMQEQRQQARQEWLAKVGFVLNGLDTLGAGALGRGRSRRRAANRRGASAPDPGTGPGLGNLCHRQPRSPLLEAHQRLNLLRPDLLEIEEMLHDEAARRAIQLMQADHGDVESRFGELVELDDRLLRQIAALAEAWPGDRRRCRRSPPAGCRRGTASGGRPVARPADQRGV